MRNRTVLVVVLISFVLYQYLHLIIPLDEEIHWDWNSEEMTSFSVDKQVSYFPKDFLWGTSTASHQCEGNNTNNNWSEWEKISGKIKTGEKADDASPNHWNLYKKDIQIMKKLHNNAYRFSVEWSKIEPQQGIIDQTALQHYVDVVKELLSNGITPLVTIHHFTDPIWFTNLGGWEKVENLDLFLKFGELVFASLRPLGVKYWCTINEPNVYATMGHFLGVFPPGKNNSTLTALVLRNMMIGHVKLYRKLKNLPQGKESMIGFSPNIMQYDPYNSHNPLDRIITKLVDDTYFNSMFQFLKTGKYRFYQPGVTDVQYEDPNAVGALDYVGINYYTHTFVQVQFNLQVPFTFVNKNDSLTDMGWEIYPEGLYRAIRRCSTLRKPLMITENGIADARDDKRASFIKKYLTAVSKALKDGYDVRGFFYWSLMDNFEWAEGYHMKFGLVKGNEERTMYSGSQAYIDFIAAFEKKNESK